MSTENDPTQPLRTGGSPDRDQPTAPVPRTGGERTDDPTRAFDRVGDRPAEPATAPLRTPVGDRAAEPATAPLPASGPAPEPVGARSGTGATATAADPLAGAGYETPATTPVGTGTRDPRTPEPTGDPTTTSVDADARPTLRVGTVVWGLVVALIGVGVIAVAAGARFDPELALIGLLALAGLGLVGGSLAAGMRRRR